MPKETDDTIVSPWSEALRLAWEAYRCGSVPVGAVICDPDGTLVARGRNRTHDIAPPGDRAPGLAGSRLAHAEVNALLALPLSPTAAFDEHTIYTTTEPCLLCAGAITMARMGSVHFAASEPVAGSAPAIVGGSPYLEDRRTSVTGPDLGVVGAFARLLHEEWGWRRAPGGLIERTTRATEPALAEIVERVVQQGRLRATAADGEDHHAAMAAIGDDLDDVRRALAPTSPSSPRNDPTTSPGEPAVPGPLSPARGRQRSGPRPRA
ncbi:MAG TPA: nucleoside deaminase [Acidimicrobiales bacterium]|nr:nucleoside deaminase [Acidimicrobiales bacterium]